jgi:hypothetical protein
VPEDPEPQNLIAALIELANDPTLVQQLRSSGSSGARDELANRGITLSEDSWTALVSSDAAQIRAALGEEFRLSFGGIQIGPPIGFAARSGTQSARQSATRSRKSAKKKKGSR